MSGGQAWGSKAPKVHSPTVGATISINPRIAPIFQFTPTEAATINFTDGGYPDEKVTLLVDTVGTDSFVLTGGTSMRTTGTLTTGATSARRFVWTFISDGIVFTEAGRTAAQA
jgi:hypothetical protein